ncbi:MAG: copper chaperone PCu(A)C [Polaromonas sp.]|jgi:copper(I)-binding protein|uniref:copper chaperone PCu(A)C n=1 Tax=Polaromonas sp. TaxID=1869339 RepID=UPI0027318995|nr:copper chaperone PCu(A)C [Polaromonas sp.]MDP2255798.1 copper chaperone PCu(A)C [Polaromonas sp.]MDP3707146.1 copper chaperone PCu(A)C [Polaromonas sp.]
MKLKALTLIAALSCGSVYAQTVEVRDAWVRTTVPGQNATGAFMKITAKDGAKLVAVASPAAGVTEVHEMKMDGDIMKMRAVSVLDIPAGKTLELKPGGYHMMLMDLKAPLPKDSTVLLTLVFQDAKGVESKVELKVPVAAVAPGAKAGDMSAMDHGKHKH